MLETMKAQQDAEVREIGGRFRSGPFRLSSLRSTSCRKVRIKEFHENGKQLLSRQRTMTRLILLDWIKLRHGTSVRKNEDGIVSKAMFASVLAADTPFYNASSFCDYAI